MSSSVPGSESVPSSDASPVAVPPMSGPVQQVTSMAVLRQLIYDILRRQSSDPAWRALLGAVQVAGVEPAHPPLWTSEELAIVFTHLLQVQTPISPALFDEYVVKTIERRRKRKRTLSFTPGKPFAVETFLEAVDWCRLDSERSNQTQRRTAGRRQFRPGALPPSKRQRLALIPNPDTQLVTVWKQGAGGGDDVREFSFDVGVEIHRLMYSSSAIGFAVPMYIALAELHLGAVFSEERIRSLIATKQVAGRAVSSLLPVMFLHIGDQLKMRARWCVAEESVRLQELARDHYYPAAERESAEMCHFFHAPIDSYPLSHDVAQAIERYNARRSKLRDLDWSSGEPDIEVEFFCKMLTVDSIFVEDPSNLGPYVYAVQFMFRARRKILELQRLVQPEAMWRSRAVILARNLRRLQEHVEAEVIRAHLELSRDANLDGDDATHDRRDIIQLLGLRAAQLGLEMIKAELLANNITMEVLRMPPDDVNVKHGAVLDRAERVARASLAQSITAVGTAHYYVAVAQAVHVYVLLLCNRVVDFRIGMDQLCTVLVHLGLDRAQSIQQALSASNLSFGKPSGDVTESMGSLLWYRFETLRSAASYYRGIDVTTHARPNSSAGKPGDSRRSTSPPASVPSSDDIALQQQASDPALSNINLRSIDEKAESTESSIDQEAQDDLSALLSSLTNSMEGVIADPSLFLDRHPSTDSLS